MQPLLCWDVTNSTTDSTTSSSDAPPALPQDSDLAIIDSIVKGPVAQSQLMKGALERAKDERMDEDEKVQALDNLEMVRSNTPCRVHR